MYDTLLFNANNIMQNSVAVNMIMSPDSMTRRIILLNGLWLLMLRVLSHSYFDNT